MALPTLSKTWQHNLNNRVTASGTVLTDNRAALRGIKNAMIGFATQPWTVAGSSNGTTAGMDATDRWSANTDLVWANAGTAHSWIVLQQTGVSATFQVLITLENASGNGQVAGVFMSAAGFTGGSTTARPTATDEVTLIAVNTAWGGNQTGTNFDILWNVSQSTDGQCTRVFAFYNSVHSTMWIFDKAKNPVTGWTNSALGFVRGGSTNVATFANLGTSGSPLIAGRHSTTNFTGFMTAEGSANASGGLGSTFGTVANQISSEWPLFPTAFYTATGSVAGRHGEFFDMWVANSARSHPDQYPGSGGAQFANVTNLVLPVNATITIV